MTNDTRAQSAFAAAKRGDFEQATTTVIDLVAEDWNNAEAHRAWGHVLMQQGKGTDAAAAYRVAVDLAPHRGDLYFDLAGALITESRQNPFLVLTNWIEANNAVNEGLSRNPHSEIGLMLLAKVEQLRERVNS